MDVGTYVGFDEGSTLGCALGADVGVYEGLEMGTALGDGVGAPVGTYVGTGTGTIVGLSVVGAAVGDSVVGARVIVGAGDGAQAPSACVTPHDVDSHGVPSNASDRLTSLSTHQPRSWSKADAR